MKIWRLELFTKSSDPTALGTEKGTWDIFAVLVQFQRKNNRPCKSHCHKRHRFQSQQKDQRHHKDVTMHLSSLQLVPLCEKPADAVDQEEGIHSPHYPYCAVCSLALDNTPDFQATTIPPHQGAELQKRMTFLILITMNILSCMLLSLRIKVYSKALTWPQESYPRFVVAQ